MKESTETNEAASAAKARFTRHPRRHFGFAQGKLLKACPSQPIPRQGSSFPSHCFAGVALQTSVVCPVFESITVFAGWQLQVTVLSFSCLSTTQCSMRSAEGGGSWLLMGGGGGAAATGVFFAAQPTRSRQNTSPAFLMPLSPCLLFSLARARLSMAILVTRPAADTIAPWNPAEGRVKKGRRANPG
jgi:hypothetical protein